MFLSSDSLRTIGGNVAESIIAHENELTRLDREIGDGDHGVNMTRGCKVILRELDSIASFTVAEACRQLGRILVVNTGGAAGALYGTLLINLGKGLDGGSPIDAFAGAVDAVKARGKSRAGQKTLLDVLVPVLCYLKSTDNIDLAQLITLSKESAEATVPMKAEKGRAAFLGSRSIGHMDPGARSCDLMVRSICEVFIERVS